MDWTNVLITVLVYALPVIFAITLHEAAHGYVARRFGDSTAYMLGRVTLNPVKHIDWLGTIVLPIVTLALSPFMFGWAKPVPVNFNNLRRPKADMLWVAAAGPASNLAQLAIWALVAAAIGHVVSPTGLAGGFWLAVADAGIKVNIMFALLNLLLACGWIALAVAIGRGFSRKALENAFNVAPEAGDPIDDLHYVPGQPFLHTISPTAFRDADPGDVLRLRACREGGGPLPRWLQFDLRRRAFVGTGPATTEEVRIEVVASDVDGMEARSYFAIRRAVEQVR